MANAFMPSVASSLNDAGQKSLLDVMQQRILQAEMQKLLFTQQRQQGMDEFNIRMRLKDQEQQERDFGFRQSEAARKTQLDETERAAKQREMTNQRGAQDIFATGVQQGASREDLLRAAMDGKVPVSMLPKEPAQKPSLAEKVAEATALTDARERTKAKYKTPKAAKVAKEDTHLPTGFRSAIRSRVGSAGFEDSEKALKSIKAKWATWRQNYPDLDASKVKSELDNIYGPRESSGGGLPPGLLEQIAAQVRANAGKP